MKKILFITGTRADYSKLKSLMKQVEKSRKLELYIFVTGMHMLSKYGSTWREIEKDGFKNVYHFINQKNDTHMDIALSNTILGLSNYVDELKPDLVIVHGDRLEALAGAIVGAFKNIKVAHIEGGEVSGTIDESIRHAITKFSHIHLVSNAEAKKRIVQLGEDEKNIFIIGSPDIDIMLSENLPSFEETQVRYDIPFNKFSILIFHPVTTEVDQLPQQIRVLVDAVIESNLNYIVIYPNNDEGNKIILDEYKRLLNSNRFRIFPSIRFEYFLTLLKNCDFIIGNSSAGVRESGVYAKPAIDIGNRQKNRYHQSSNSNIIHVNGIYKEEILDAIRSVNKLNVKSSNVFGDGKSDKRFIKILESKEIWELEIQKNFIDVTY